MKGIRLAILFSLFCVLFPEPSRAQSITRGPYLQTLTEDSVIVRWRTDVATDSVVRYGFSAASLASLESVAGSRTEHAVQLTGLGDHTQYFYSVGNSGGAIAGDASYHFTTAPIPGTAVPTRLWIIGDSGTANANARAVRDAYKSYSSGSPSDFMLMLGDNAYNDGTDAEYQAAVFDTYPELLRQLPLWSTLGNHDGHSADSFTQSGPYYDIFDFPVSAEAGGVASGTEAYYSFDYGNIHFIVLDSYDTDRSPGGTMMTWLEADLSANDKPWIIAFWHHPPYTKGSHDSDTEGRLVDMREVALPILESWGVDLVLGGHSHSYERSMLIDGHYLSSDTLDIPTMIKDIGDGSELGDGAYVKPSFIAAANEGAVYAVAGSSGKTSGGSLDHPVMYVSLNLLGSMVVDVNGDTLDAVFIDNTGAVQDDFTITKTNAPVPPSASFTYACTILDCNFTDTSTDIDGSLVSWSWDFGDGNTSTSQNPAHGYAADGSYTVELTVTDNDGLADMASASVTVSTPPPVVDVTAESEIQGSGTVSGAYTDTHDDDGNPQSITERESGGKKQNRHSFLVHTWQFTLPASNLATVYANAWSGGSPDDSFRFLWSTDNSDYSEMFVISTTDDANVALFPMPMGTSGTVYIRVEDTDQSAGNSSLDTVFVDHLFIRADSTEMDPPAAPSLLSATANGADRVDLAWTDNATDEAGFAVERSSDGVSFSAVGGTLADETTYSDTGLAPSTSYWYRVFAYNAGGASAESNVDSATTDNGIILGLSGRKEKGQHVVTLAWSGSTAAEVDIFRDGGLLVTVPDTGSYEDFTGNKGNGSYDYQVCEAGTADCSGTQAVSF